MKLQQLIISEIEQTGPMPVDRYMELCLAHPQHGYYMKQDPFGQAGDFVTAPEISQIFGEMIGIWAITQWQKLGAPENCALVEAGPGRGTLMADILRAIKVVPSFKPEIHLVEISPVLKRKQKEKLGDGISWHNKIPELDKPSIFIANEFFDALPIKQFIGKTERKIVAENGRLAFNLAVEDGLVKETCPIALELMKQISHNYAAGIIIDYGYIENRKIDTLQALRGHNYTSPLENPGDCDLTAHVDFGGLASISEKKCQITTQREFLLAHGADVRAKILNKENDLDRLISKNQMGELFKVLCF